MLKFDDPNAITFSFVSDWELHRKGSSIETRNLTSRKEKRPTEKHNSSKVLLVFRWHVLENTVPET